MAEAADPAKEHAMLAKVLAAKLAPEPSPDLAELAAELEAEGAGGQLSLGAVERVLLARLSAGRQLLAERLKYLKECSQRCEEVRRDAKFPPAVLAQLPEVQKTLGNYGALSLTCAELFQSQPVPVEQAAATLAALWESRELSLPFLVAVADAVEAELLAPVFGLLLTKACQRLQGRDLVDHKGEELGFITGVCSTKGPLARLLVTLPAFHPPPQPAAEVNPMLAMMQGARGSRDRPQQPGEGFRLQTESMLGMVLSPTCIDTAIYKEKSARQMHFQGLSRKSRPAVSSSQSLLRHTLGEILAQGTGVINPLLRTGEATRNAVLCWFGALITGTEPRTKSSNTLEEGGGPSHFVDSMENSPHPMHQNLDMRLQMQLMQAKMLGFATPGMAVNVFWCLLELVKPIKLAKAGSLDQLYIHYEGAPHAEILGGFAKEARFGDSEEVDAAKEFARAKGAPSPAFTTQVFWLALRAMHVLFVPVIKEDMCFAYAAHHFFQKDPAKMEAALGEHLLNETIFGGSAFIQNLAGMLNLQMAFCLIAVLPEKAQEIVEDRLTGSVLPEQVSEQWSALPSCILEDVIEVLEYYSNIRPPGDPGSELFTFLDAKLLLYIVTFMLGSGSHVRNPSLRGKATKILMSLAKMPAYGSLLETSPVLANDIVPGCIRVFTAVEKTKQSYYDIRMQLKYELRIPIMELMERVLPLQAHKAALKQFAADKSEEFLRFLNQMMNDATMQLEEGLDTLAEIRKLVREGGEGALQRPTGEQVAEDEQTDGADIYRRSRADPKEHCKTYMKMGNRTIRTLWSISREAPTVIVSKLNVLQQLLHNCLNSCLDRLVGPRCLELKMEKGKMNDFAEYNFEPKELLRMIAETYVFVARADRERVQKMIVEDGRSYRPKTFQKAAQILKREQMISSELLKDFETFVEQLNKLSAAQEAALANVTVPDEFLDPIMSEIMEDPVLLPTSNTVMDRKVIERHVMSNDDDPFNRMPLSVNDLVPQEELRAQIQAFCAKHGIALGAED